MARWPGTESPVNRAGFRPGGAVRCRRTRAHREMGLADRRGVVSEVRAGQVRVLLEASGRSVWLSSDAVVDAPAADEPGLERLAAALRLLGGHRLEIEDERVVIFTAGCTDQAFAALSEALGPALTGWEARAEGVHEMAVCLDLEALAEG